MTVCDQCGELAMNTITICENCRRDNEEYDELNDDCTRCGGNGEIEWDDDACSIPNMITCYKCKGSGVEP